MLRFAIRPALLVTLGALALGACGVRGPLELPKRTAEETSTTTTTTTTTTTAAPAAETGRTGVTWNTPTGLTGQGSQEQVAPQQSSPILQAGSGGPNDPFRVDRAPGTTPAATRPRATAPRSTIFNGFVLDPLL